MKVIILMIVSYLLGSIPNALWIGKVFCGIDVREYGSKNTGSTNAARVLGAKWGLLTLALDILKGLVPTLIAVSLENGFFSKSDKYYKFRFCVSWNLCDIGTYLFYIFEI